MPRPRLAEEPPALELTHERELALDPGRLRPDPLRGVISFEPRDVVVFHMAHRDPLGAEIESVDVVDAVHAAPTHHSAMKLLMHPHARERERELQGRRDVEQGDGGTPEASPFTERPRDRGMAHLVRADR